MSHFKSPSRSALGGALAVATVVFASNMAAAAPAREIPSAFLVAKSGNKNQVHYAVGVDDASCVPVGTAPVRPYWRMLEQSADATEPLLDREQRAYGIERQDVDGSTVRVVLRALPTRPITIHTWRAADGTCGFSAALTIAGASARLHDVYVKQKFLGVDYLLLTGWSDGGTVVRERIGL